ncbi:hypothetical protein T4D_12061 [Trichinella pseudospiralis]|uniref:Uncharacterized protein n=1 Tax=Trichinella pseudospiralis TaxID=6337 RepID=A0A0V1FGA7_TRIPS|nr:hypothetical protein T4D_12061 [Trichinella pseudospiralis]
MVNFTTLFYIYFIASLLIVTICRRKINRVEGTVSQEFRNVRGVGEATKIFAYNNALLVRSMATLTIS